MSKPSSQTKDKTKTLLIILAIIPTIILSVIVLQIYPESESSNQTEQMSESESSNQTEQMSESESSNQTEQRNNFEQIEKPNSESTKQDIQKYLITILTRDITDCKNTDYNEITISQIEAYTKTLEDVNELLEKITDEDISVNQSDEILEQIFDLFIDLTICIYTQTDVEFPSNDNNNFESQIIKCDTTSSGKYLEIKVSLKNTDKITHDYRGNLMGIDIDKNIIDAQYSYAFDVDPNEIVILSTLLEDSFEIDSCTIQIKVD